MLASVSRGQRLSSIRRVAVPAVRGVKSKIVRRRNPDAPTNPRSAYVMFIADPEARAKYSDLSATESFSALAAEWKTLTPEQRAPYIEKAEADKERFNAEMEAFDGPLSVVKEIKAPRDPEKPKRPASGFASFVKANFAAKRETMPDAVVVTPVMKALSEEWNKMSDAEKEEYKPPAAEVAKYKKAMEKYKAKKEAEEEAAAAKLPPTLSAEEKHQLQLQKRRAKTQAARAAKAETATAAAKKTRKASPVQLSQKATGKAKATQKSVLSAKAKLAAAAAEAAAAEAAEAELGELYEEEEGEGVEVAASVMPVVKSIKGKGKR